MKSTTILSNHNILQRNFIMIIFLPNTLNHPTEIVRLCINIITDSSIQMNKITRVRYSLIIISQGTIIDIMVNGSKFSTLKNVSLAHRGTLRTGTTRNTDGMTRNILGRPGEKILGTTIIILDYVRPETHYLPYQ